MEDERNAVGRRVLAAGGIKTEILPVIEGRELGISRLL